MTTTSEPPAAPAAAPTRTGPHWIEDWRPEEEEFWENGGKQVARRNLLWSIFAEHLGFSVWLIWSVSSAFLVATFEIAGRTLLLHGDDVLLDGVAVKLSPAPYAVLSAPHQPGPRRLARRAPRRAPLRHRRLRPRGRHGGRSSAGGCRHALGADGRQAGVSVGDHR